MLTAQQNNADLQQLQKNQQGIATDTEKWKAVIERDESKDGLFVFAVRSTGIYCKPSCPARHPNMDQRSEEHTSELQSLAYLVCRLLLEKKKKKKTKYKTMNMKRKQS